MYTEDRVRDNKSRRNHSMASFRLLEEIQEFHKLFKILFKIISYFISYECGLYLNSHTNEASVVALLLGRCQEVK